MLKSNTKLYMAHCKVIIRVDGNSKIGLGHIYRGIALADMLKHNFNVSFITRYDSTTTPLRSTNYEVSLIPEKINLKNEISFFVKHVEKNSIIVLDGYEFTQSYQQQIKDKGYKLVYIDDLIKGVQKADLVINHNPGINIHHYKNEPNTKLALGLDYTLLRKSFLNQARKDLSIDNTGGKVLLSFGGADPLDLTFKFASILCNNNSISQIDIIIGSAYKFESILSLIDESETKIKIHKNLNEDELVYLMKSSSFAIVPSSTILLELMACNTTIISGYFVDNQVGIYNFLNSNNTVIGIGDLRKIDDSILNNAIKKTDKHSYKKMIDGLQAERIISLFKLL